MCCKPILWYCGCYSSPHVGTSEESPLIPITTSTQDSRVDSLKHLLQYRRLWDSCLRGPAPPTCQSFYTSPAQLPPVDSLLATWLQCDSSSALSDQKAYTGWQQVNKLNLQTKRIQICDKPVSSTTSLGYRKIIS